MKQYLKQLRERRMAIESGIRLGVTSGGCAGYEYVIEYSDLPIEGDSVLDFGKFNIVINKESLPFLTGCTLDWVVDGINEYFKIINPNEEASCGCGVSVQF